MHRAKVASISAIAQNCMHGLATTKTKNTQVGIVMPKCGLENGTGKGSYTRLVVATRD